MKTLVLVMGLLVAGVLSPLSIHGAGQDTYWQFAKMSLVPLKTGVLPKSTGDRGSGARLQLAEKLIVQSSLQGVGNWDRIVASIDLSAPTNSSRETLTIDTVFVGYGNFKTSLDIVEVFHWHVTKNSRLGTTLLFESPSRDEARTWLGLTWKKSF